MYFVEGVTQAEIARRLGTNRLRINRILVEARQNGLVGITLNSRLTSCVALEQELVRDFGLKAATIIPTPHDAELVHVLLGKATADFVSRYLSENPVNGLGIGWGGTLREMVRNISAARYPKLSVNSMMGGITHGIEINTFNVVSNLARRLGADCHYLAAPIYASSPESRDTILAQEVFKDAFSRIYANDLAILSIGDTTRNSILVRHGLPSDVAIGELSEAGAVCDVCGQFLNQSGTLIDHPINGRAIAMPISDLRRIPTIIFAAGGKHKVRAVAAVLKSGLGSVLVSDEATTRAAVNVIRRGS